MKTTELLTSPILLMKIVRWCALALIALLPVFFLPAGWIMVAQAKTLLIALVVIAAALAWGGARFLEGSYFWPRSLLMPLAAALPAAYFISALASGTSASALVSGSGHVDTVASMVLLASIFFLVSVAFENAYEAATFSLRALFAGAGALMFLQVAHVLVPALSFGVLNGKAASVFGSWHEFGIASALLLFLSLTLRKTIVAEGSWKWLVYAVGAASVLMLVVVNMLDVWVSLGVLCIAYAAYEWWATRASFDLKKIAIPLLVGIVAFVCAASSSAMYAHLPPMLQVPQVEVRPSWLGTIEVAKQSVQHVSPLLFGTGPNSFTRQWSLYKPLGVNTSDFWSADFDAGVGYVPTALITSGLLGIVAWLGLFAALLWAAWRFVRGSSESELADVYVAVYGSALYMASFLILYAPSITLIALFFVFLALIAAARGMHAPVILTAKPRDRRAAAYAAVFVIAAAVVAVSALATLRAVASNMLVKKSVAVYAQTHNVDEALRLIRAALIVDSKNDDAHRAAVELGIVKLSELARSTDQATASLQITLQTTIQHGLAAVSANSGDYQNWLALAMLYQNLAGVGVQGAYEGASGAYARAAQENPSSPIPYVQMAQLDMALSKYPEALQFADRALQLKPNYALAYHVRSQYYLKQGDLAHAVDDAFSASQYAPQDPDAWRSLGSALYASGRYVEASQALEKALAIGGDSADTLYVLGLSYEKQSRHQEALAVLKRVATMNPADGDLAEIISKISIGQPIDGAPAKR